MQREREIGRSVEEGVRARWDWAKPQQAEAYAVGREVGWGGTGRGQRLMRLGRG